MLIKLNDVPEEGRDYDGLEVAAVMGLEDVDNARLQEPVSYQLRATCSLGALCVSGTVRGNVDFRCSRCDEWFSQEVEDRDFASSWNLADDGRTPPERAEGGVETIKKKGKGKVDPAKSGKPACLESVDLTEDIRESMILAFPHYPVCDPACKGLCPQCGTNLNKEPCNCQPPPDDRWVGLDRLKLKEEP